MITKDNVVFVYRESDSDSLELARYYQELHNLQEKQLISIPCSNTEILANEDTFNTEVLFPLYEAIYSSASELLNDNIWVIVVGMNVPGGFYDSNDIISSTSRIARINHFFSKQIRNDLYNRIIFENYGSIDSQKALIVSRIDAPTLALAKRFVDNAKMALKQITANGTFYLDPYSDLFGSDAQEYEDLMIDFSERVLPNLNLNTFVTKFIDPYIDSVIPFVQGDSFLWSWFTNRASSSFFRSTNTMRGFFYNADYDGAFTMRDEENNRWPFLCMEAGYIATAGAMSNPTIKGFLNLRPLFNSLLNGTTIGEAMLYSVPFLDWTIAFFGDPLIKISFPAQEIINTTVIDEDESWRLQSMDLARTMAYLLRKENLTKNLRQEILDNNELLIEVSLLLSAHALVNKNNKEQRESQLSELVEKFIEYPERRNLFMGLSISTPTINDYLREKGYKLSRLINDVLIEKNNIEENNLFEEGYWELEFTLSDDAGFFTFYDFQLEVSEDEDFSSILFTISSENGNIDNWYYEKEENEFFQLLLNGISSSFIGRRIKYIADSDEYLTRTNIYYFRIAQIYNDGITRVVYTPRIVNDIIWT